MDKQRYILSMADNGPVFFIILFLLTPLTNRDSASSKSCGVCPDGMPCFFSVARVQVSGAIWAECDVEQKM